MPQLGPLEIVVIFVVALLVFGPQRLPEIGRQVGKAVREFRRFQQSVTHEIGSAMAEDATGRVEPAPTLPPRLLPDASEATGSAPAPPSTPTPGAGTAETPAPTSDTD